MPCWRSQDCLEDQSAEVTVQFTNLDAAALSDAETRELGAALAGDMAAACDVDNSSVVDLTGSNATVTFGPGGRVSAFVRGLAALSAHDLAARLYSASFRATLANSTADVVGPAAGVQVASVSLEPKAFAAVTTSTTVTSTTTVAPATTAAAIHEDITTQRHQDVMPNDHSGAGALAAPLWLASLVAAAAL